MEKIDDVQAAKVVAQATGPNEHSDKEAEVSSKSTSTSAKDGVDYSSKSDQKTQFSHYLVR